MLWIFLYSSFCQHQYACVLGIHPGVGSLVHAIHTFPFSTYFHRVFQSAGPIYTPTRIIEEFPLFLLIFLLTWYCHCNSFVLSGLMLAISVGVKWCLIVVLLSSFLMTNDVKHLFNMFIWRRKWQPTPVFLPGKSYGVRGAWRAIVHGITKSWIWLSN